jgi:hypothetical protein
LKSSRAQRKRWGEQSSEDFLEKKKKKRGFDCEGEKKEIVVYIDL